MKSSFAKVVRISVFSRRGIQDVPFPFQREEDQEVEEADGGITKIRNIKM